MVPKGSSFDYLTKMGTTLACIIHGLLLQREAFSNIINDLAVKHPDIVSDVKSKLMGKESEFRSWSDDVLQFACGRRAEVIDSRRKTFKPSSSQVGTLLKKIPPSSTHLFEEDSRESYLITPGPQELNSNVAPLKRRNLKASCLQNQGFQRNNGKGIVQKGSRKVTKKSTDISPKELGLDTQSDIDNYPRQFKGGRLKDFVQVWKELGAPRSILSIIQGYSFPFVAKPPLVPFSNQNLAHFATDPQVFLTTDASDITWGAQLGTQTYSQSWTAEQKAWHINLKELYAVYAAVRKEENGRLTLIDQCDTQHFSEVGRTADRPGGEELAQYLGYLFRVNKLSPATIKLHTSVVATLANPINTESISRHPLVKHMI
nr:unnamed protein product [Callosobruchus chinensis]